MHNPQPEKSYIVLIIAVVTLFGLLWIFLVAAPKSLKQSSEDDNITGYINKQCSFGTKYTYDATQWHDCNAIKLKVVKPHKDKI